MVCCCWIRLRLDRHHAGAAAGFNGSDGACGGGGVNGVVLCTGIDLAAATVATNVDLVFAEVDVVGGGVGDSSGKTTSRC